MKRIIYESSREATALKLLAILLNHGLTQDEYEVRNKGDITSIFRHGKDVLTEGAWERAINANMVSDVHEVFLKIKREEKKTNGF